jgi:hypothetical protein
MEDRDLADVYRSIGLTGVYDEIFPKVDPVPTRPEPTARDFERGWMRRYFLQRKRPRGSLPFEVDRPQWQSFQNREQGISRRIYQGAEVKWRVSGPRETILNSKGYPVRAGAEEANRNLAELYEEDLPGLTEVLDDPLEHWRDQDR